MGDTVPKFIKNAALRSAVLASTIALASTGSWAARSFTPQSGTWVVSSEIDGKPGRGLAIDVQGNTFFMQVFAYEKNGDATFYTATGQMDGNSVTAPLIRYKNGRSLGGAMQDAVEDKSVGQVTIHFTNGLKGMIQFPGEQASAIERFLVVSNEPSVTNPRVQLGERTMRLFAMNEQDEPSLTVRAKLRRTEAGLTQLIWLSPPTVTIGEPGPEFECQVSGEKNRIHCLPVVKKSLSKPRSGLPIIESLDLQFAGYDINGVLHTGGEKPQKLSITGFDEGALLKEPSYREGITTYNPERQHNYISASFGENSTCITGSCVATLAANTLMPLNGTWVVEDELTGKPGRGIALDVQGNTVIIQLFNYRADGQPTFHMGSGTYQSKGMGSRASVATISLRQYRGGRSFGGTPQSARLESEVGSAVIEFNSPPADKDTEFNFWWTQGILKLPGEAPVKIRRLQTDTPGQFSEQMFGDWYVAHTDKVEHFNQAQGDGATTTDGKILCLPNDPSSRFNMSCGEPNGVMWNWLQALYMPTMGRAKPFLRLRDRFGNATGLGAFE
ncbi:hypothetical protein [Comamonas koreensis]|uniref:Uncharacterized protein n=1 Tax=Comamonas koreensis TaxID=160825 RepID=A0AAW4XXX2_9BURK|nr:hypothetical protein [Comamonas koreensis]MCD2166262.1 hypothetical protein [Comamonas koreensis]